MHVDRQTGRVGGTCRSQSRGWRSGDGGGSGCWVALHSAGCDHAIAISPNGHTAGWGNSAGKLFFDQLSPVSLSRHDIDDV